MKRTLRIVPIALTISLTACAGLLGGGGKQPAYLVTLTSDAPEPAQIARNATAAQAITIATPAVARELGTVRVPVQVNQNNIQYVTDLQLVDSPARLFANLVAETVRRSTGRVVLNPNQTGLDPGTVVSGVLQRFGYDAGTGQVIVQYDASMAAPGGHVESRRFTATAPADGTARTVGPALNRAANEVAQQVAQWIGG